MSGRALLAIVLFFGAAGRLDAEAPSTFLDRLDAERLEQTGTVITIVFDDSGSMGGTKITQAKAAFRQWIAGVPATHRLGLVALNAGRLVPLGRDNRPALLTAVERLQAGGGTPLVPNIRAALADIERRRGEVGPYERHILLVFTDGQDTTSEGNSGVQRELERARGKGVETIGIGYHGEGDYMRASATRYYDARNVAELQTSLAKVDSEIGDTSDIVIDERTLLAMQNVSPPPAPVAARVAEPSVPASPTRSPQSRRSIPVGMIIVFFGGIWLLSRVLKRGIGK